MLYCVINFQRKSEKFSSYHCSRSNESHCPLAKFWPRRACPSWPCTPSPPTFPLFPASMEGKLPVPPDPHLPSEPLSLLFPLPGTLFSLIHSWHRPSLSKGFYRNVPTSESTLMPPQPLTLSRPLACFIKLTAPITLTCYACVCRLVFLFPLFPPEWKLHKSGTSSV